MKLDVGTPLRYPDGEQVGTIHKVVFDPETATVCDLVVETADLVGRSILVPINLLRTDSGDVLTLAADRETVAGLPEYTVEEFVAAPEGWQVSPNYMAGDVLFPAGMTYPLMPIFEETSAPEGTVEWGLGTEVDCTDGRFGVVDQVIIDESDGRMIGLVARADADPADRRQIPPHLVQSYDSQMVQLTCSLADLQAQPRADVDPGAEPEPETLIPSS